MLDSGASGKVTPVHVTPRPPVIRSGTARTHVRRRKNKIAPPSPTTKTGILTAITGNLGTVNINGSSLTLPMLDHISTTIAIGTTVVVQVTGNSGVIIGSLGTTTRTTATTPNNLAVPNPTPPRPGTNTIYYTTYFPTDALTWNGTSWVQSSSNYGNGNGGFGIATLGGNRNVILQDASSTGALFFGANRFGDLTNKNIKSVELYVPRLAYPTNTFKFYTHLYGSVPAGAPTIANGPSVVTANTVNGWIQLPSSFITPFLTGTAGIAIAGTPNNGYTSATIPTTSPNGTLRIGWTR